MKPPRRLPIRIFLLAVIALSGLASNVAVNEKRYDLAAIAVIVGVACGAVELFFVQKLTGHIKGGRLTTREYLKLASKKSRDEVRLRLTRLQTALGWENSTTVSMTVHLAVTRADCSDCHSSCSLIQLIGYVGKRSGGEGRLNSDLKGIIGRCLRTRAPQTVNFENEREFTRLMTKEFGYYPDEVSFHDTEGRSYLCSPIGREGGAIAVLYIYSTEPNVFPNTATSYAQLPLVLSACSDLAHILEEDQLVLDAIT